MCHEEEMNPRVNQRKRNKREAKEYKKLYAATWDIPISILWVLIIALLFILI
jgi:hypothetical protein